MIFLHLNEENDTEEDLIDEYEAEYMFLTEQMGWKDNTPIESRVHYLFLTEQMNWKKGLKLFKEKGETAVTKELQQIHEMEGFQPKH